VSEYIWVNNDVKQGRMSQSNSEITETQIISTEKIRATFSRTK